jgi:hypothetical protein
LELLRGIYLNVLGYEGLPGTVLLPEEPDEVFWDPFYVLETLMMMMMMVLMLRAGACEYWKYVPVSTR